MPGKDFFFFISTNETKAILQSIVKKESGLHAAISGMYDAIDDKYFINNLLDLPLNLEFYDRFDNRFVVQKNEEEFLCREIEQKRGGVKYDLDANLSGNYTYISFGGVNYDIKKVLAGELLMSNNNEISKYIFKLFADEIKSYCHFKDDRFYISDDIMKLYKDGFILCSGAIGQLDNSNVFPIALKK
jgi:hypothetical protein